MKNDRIIKIVCVISSFMLIAGVLCLYAAIVNDKTVLLAAAIPCILLAIGGMSFSFTLSLKASRKVKNSWKEYVKLPKIDIDDFKAEIDKVRENFAADTSADKNRFPKPDFNGVKPYYDFSVLNNGKIYYGILVEANEIIFKRSRSGFDAVTAGVVAYSTDEYFDEKPYELNAIAKIMYANKRYNSLRNESRYFSNIKLEGELTEGRNIYMTTLLLYRNHLPLGYMAGELFPVIAAPRKCTSVFAVDSKYWTDALISNFIYGDVNYKEDGVFGELDGQDFPDEE